MPLLYRVRTSESSLAPHMIFLTEKSCGRWASLLSQTKMAHSRDVQPGGHPHIFPRRVFILMTYFRQVLRNRMKPPLILRLRSGQALTSPPYFAKATKGRHDGRGNLQTENVPKDNMRVIILGEGYSDFPRREPLSAITEWSVFRRQKSSWLRNLRADQRRILKFRC